MVTETDIRYIQALEDWISAENLLAIQSALDVERALRSQGFYYRQYVIESCEKFLQYYKTRNENVAKGQ